MKGEICPNERGQHSKISKPEIRQTLAGKDVIEGVRDMWPDALEYMYDKGFIGADQRDAGNQLRALYVAHTVSAETWIREGGRANESEEETESDRAQQAFYKALDAIDKEDRAVTRAVCVEWTAIPADYMLIQQIRSGLDDLYKHFRQREKNI